MLQAAKHPVSHEVVSDPADGKHLQSVFGRDDRSRAGSTGDGHSDLLHEMGFAVAGDAGDWPGQAIECVETYGSVVVTHTKFLDYQSASRSATSSSVMITCGCSRRAAARMAVIFCHPPEARTVLRADRRLRG